MIYQHFLFFGFAITILAYIYFCNEMIENKKINKNAIILIIFGLIISFLAPICNLLFF
jgi:uncharacterized membrane protein